MQAKILERQSKLRLFEQLHQTYDDYVYWRASGSCRCNLCGLTYREHCDDLERFDRWGDSVLKRLCSGEFVKL